MRAGEQQTGCSRCWQQAIQDFYPPLRTSNICLPHADILCCTPCAPTRPGHQTWPAHKRIMHTPELVGRLVGAVGAQGHLHHLSMTQPLVHGLWGTGQGRRQSRSQPVMCDLAASTACCCAFRRIHKAHKAFQGESYCVRATGCGVYVHGGESSRCTVVQHLWNLHTRSKTEHDTHFAQQRAPFCTHAGCIVCRQPVTRHWP